MLWYDPSGGRSVAVINVAREGYGICDTRTYLMTNIIYPVPTKPHSEALPVLFIIKRMGPRGEEASGTPRADNGASDAIASGEREYDNDIPHISHHRFLLAALFLYCLFVALVFARD